MKYIKSTLVIIGFVIQILVLYLLLFFLDQPYIYQTIQFLSIVIILLIVSSTMKREYKISWIMFFAIVPIFAFVLYIFYGNRKFTNKISKMEKKIDKEKIQTTFRFPNEKKIQQIENPNVQQQAEIFNQLSNYNVYSSDNIEYFKVGEDYFADILEKMKNAKKYILIEYYIFARGELYDEMHKILIEKVREGVEVYIIYDKLGSMARFKEKDEEILRKEGINILPFNKRILNLYTFINFRTHRKITIIDGEYTYTGGNNVGDEYTNVVERFGHWKDMGIRFSGEGSGAFIKAFFRSWILLSNDNIDLDKYLLPEKEKIDNDAIIIPFTSEPTNYNAVAENSYMRMIVNAKKYIYISTPYLIIDEEVSTCLKLSAASGVDVRIIVPGIPDKKIVYMATKAHFQELIEAGVKIYTYTPGFVHGKVIVVDDVMSIVGSINFDYRSLLWNYECATFVANEEVALTIKDDFNDMFSKSNMLDKSNYKQEKLPKRLFNGIIKVVEPLF